MPAAAVSQRLLIAATHLITTATGGLGVTADGMGSAGGGAGAASATMSSGAMTATFEPPVLITPLTTTIGGSSHIWRDCHFADSLSPSLLKHVLKVEGLQQNDSLANG